MPIEVRVDPTERIATTWIRGKVSRAEIASHFHDLERDSEILTHDQLLIIEGTDVSGLTSADFRSLAGLASSLWGDREFRTAVVTSTDAEFGMTRVFISMRDRADDLLCVFRSREEAYKWLRPSGQNPTAKS